MKIDVYARKWLQKLTVCPAMEEEEDGCFFCEGNFSSEFLQVVRFPAFRPVPWPFVVFFQDFLEILSEETIWCGVQPLRRKEVSSNNGFLHITMAVLRTTFVTPCPFVLPRFWDFVCLGKGMICVPIYSEVISSEKCLFLRAFLHFNGNHKYDPYYKIQLII